MKKTFLALFSVTALAFLNACDNGTSSEDDITSLKDARDGQIYNVVKIGNQVWMAENLRYEIPTADGASPSSFCYENNEAYCNQYGRLYAWIDAMNVCPQGWHLPDTTEWNKLFTTVGGSNIAGTKLKATSTLWSSNGSVTNGGGTDDYGFGALPAGFKKGSSFFDLTLYGNFWTTAKINNDAYHVTVFYNRNSAEYIIDSQNFALSVRCIKN